jgi:WD40 repeat protein
MKLIIKVSCLCTIFLINFAAQANSVAMTQFFRLSKTLEGHTGFVSSVVYSPDGKTLASGSLDHTIKIWDTKTGKCINTLKGHKDWVLSVVYSPDGLTLASGSHDNTIKIWDIKTGKCINTLAGFFKGHTDSVYSVAYSPDGLTLASHSWDCTIKIWDIKTGTCINTLEGHIYSVFSVAYSPDGLTLASASWDNTIKIWTIHPQKLLERAINKELDKSYEQLTEENKENTVYAQQVIKAKNLRETNPENWDALIDETFCAIIKHLKEKKSKKVVALAEPTLHEKSCCLQ